MPLVKPPWWKRALGYFVNLGLLYREWRHEKFISRLTAEKLGIPVELAYALGQDATGKKYLEAKAKLKARGITWVERPIRPEVTPEDVYQKKLRETAKEAILQESRLNASR